MSQPLYEQPSGAESPHQVAELGIPPATKKARYLPWLDRVGGLLAGLCAVHCFIFMLGSVVLGFTASSIFFNPGIRWLIVFLIACMSVGSLLARGKNPEHGLPGWLIVSGLAAIIVANMWQIWSLTGEILSLSGGMVLALGHWAQLHKGKRLQRESIRAPKPYLPRSIGVILLLVAAAMAVYQLPAVSRSNMLWGNGTTAGAGGQDTIAWGLLTQLDVRTGEVGPDLQKVVGGTVKIPGFIVPIDEGGMTFLLAPYAGACVHGPTPPLNQIIYVTMEPTAQPIDPWSWEPIWVTGTLTVLQIDSPFGTVGFTMDGTSTEIYR